MPAHRLTVLVRLVRELVPLYKTKLHLPNKRPPVPGYRHPSMGSEIPCRLLSCCKMFLSRSISWSSARFPSRSADQLAGLLFFQAPSLKGLEKLVKKFRRLGHLAAFGAALFIEIDQQALQRGVVELKYQPVKIRQHADVQEPASGFIDPPQGGGGQLPGGDRRAGCRPYFRVNDQQLGQMPFEAIDGIARPPGRLWSAATCRRFP